MTVQEDETLRHVLHRAAAELVPSASFPEAFVDFYREGQHAELHRELFLLDAAGRVRVSRDRLDEPVSEVIRAGDAGVLGGDPLRPYLHIQHGIGNGILADWPSFIELLRLWWMFMGGLATVSGVRQFFKFAGESLRRQGPESVEVIESHADE